MPTVSHLSREQLEIGLEKISQSPKDQGTLDMIVRRPKIGVRDIVENGVLNKDVGLEGDNWKTRGGSERPAKLETQITLTNSRAIQHIARQRCHGRARAAVAGAETPEHTHAATRMLRHKRTQKKYTLKYAIFIPLSPALTSLEFR